MFHQGIQYLAGSLWLVKAEKLSVILDCLASIMSGDLAGEATCIIDCIIGCFIIECCYYVVDYNGTYSGRIVLM